MNEKLDTIGTSNDIRHNALTNGGKLRIFIISAILLAGSLVFMPHLSWSIERDPKEALIASLPQGERFDNDGFSYVLLPTLRAEKTDPSSPSGNPIERKGQFSVFIHKRFEPSSICTTHGSTGEDVRTHPVVLNLETKSVGIITGNLWLKLNNLQDAPTIADGYHLTLTFTNAAMETAFYDIPDDTDILQLRRQLAADPRVVRVTLDMVDRIHHPR